MSIIYCEKHDRRWDSDRLDMCPVCENEPVGEVSERERILLAAKGAVQRGAGLNCLIYVNTKRRYYEGEGK